MTPERKKDIEEGLKCELSSLKIMFEIWFYRVWFWPFKFFLDYEHEHKRPLFGFHAEVKPGNVPYSWWKWIKIIRK